MPLMTDNFYEYKCILDYKDPQGRDFIVLIYYVKGYKIILMEQIFYSPQKIYKALTMCQARF